MPEPFGTLTNGAAPAKPPPTLDQQKEEIKRLLVQVVPITDDIGRPDQAGLSPTLHSWRVDKLPPLTIWTCELISFDEQVKIGLQMRDGPLFAADAIASGPDEEIVKYLQDEWNSIWDSSSEKLLRTKVFGSLGFEVMAKQDAAGLVRFKGLKELHPSMCRPLSNGHEVQGIVVRPFGHFNFWTDHDQDEFKKKGKRRLVAPKCLWTTFGARFENPFGESILHYCYSAWYEKVMEHGAKKLCQQRMVKDAWIGDIFLYPPGVAMTVDDGTAEGKKKSWREFFREAGETRLSGGIMALPLLRDPVSGQPTSDYRPPQAIPGETPIFDWLERLNVEIWKGLGIPREVLEASGTGSGFSGRSIPFVMFASSLLVEFQQIVRPILRMILRPWIALNFGVNPNEYDLKPMAVDQLIQKLTGGATQSAIGGAGVGMGGMPGGGNPLAAMMGGGGMPQQMSEDAIGAVIDRKLSQRSPLQNMHDALPDVEGVSRQAADMAKWLVASTQCRQFGEEVKAADVLNGAGIQNELGIRKQFDVSDEDVVGWLNEPETEPASPPSSPAATRHESYKALSDHVSTADPKSLDVEHIRQRFGEIFAGASKEEVKRILAAHGYTTTGSKQDMLALLIGVLERRAVNRHQASFI